jgi:hypothetical protein
MSNLEKALKKLLSRAHKTRGRGGKRFHHECGLLVVMGDIDSLDPKVAIRVNSGGEARLPPKTTQATIVLDAVRDRRLRFLNASYVSERGRIKHLRLNDRLTGDEEFWWLTVTSAINTEASQ